MVKVRIGTDARTYDVLYREDVINLAEEMGFPRFKILKYEDGTWVAISLSDLPIKDGEILLQPYEYVAEAERSNLMLDLFHFLVQLSKEGIRETDPNPFTGTRLRWEVVEDPEWLTDDDIRDEDEGDTE